MKEGFWVGSLCTLHVVTRIPCQRLGSINRHRHCPLSGPA